MSRRVLFFAGCWEKAAIYKETVVRAFEELPEGAEKDEALQKTYALLKLNDALVRRAGLGRRIIGEGDAQGAIGPGSGRIGQFGAQHDIQPAGPCRAWN